MIYCSHLLKDEEMKILLETYPVGMEIINFGIGSNLDNFELGLKNYQKLKEYLPNYQLTLHGPFLDLNPVSNDSMVKEASLRRYEQAYSAAKIIGAKKVIFHSCLLPLPNYSIGWVEQITAFWNQFLSDKDTDIQICMENVYDSEANLLLEVAKGIKHPAFSLCLDIGHANVYSKQSVVKWMEILKGYIGHFHFHDNRGTKDEHLALGDGNIPIELVLNIIKEDYSHIDITLENTSLQDFIKSIEIIGMKGSIDG